MRRSRRGFTLMELMVVIIIVGIVSALAIPSMLSARNDRHAYDDAGQIMQLFRDARTRAVARGGAVLVAFNIGPANMGVFQMWESVTVNPSDVGGANETPVASCKTPTVWAPVANGNPNIVFVEGLDENGTIEQQYNIQTQFIAYTPAATPVNAGFVCFTPLGRSYFNPAAPVFDGLAPTLTPLEFQVARLSGTNPIGTIRSVLVPPNGMARVFSHVL